MQLNEKWFEPCEGKIRAEYVNLATGEKFPAIEKSNIIVYRAADIMARILAGDTSYIPKYVGYIYAPAPTMENPSSTRLHTWDVISTDVNSAGGNMILSPLGSNPSFAVDGDEDNYSGNAVTLSALSDAAASLVFPPTGGYEATGPQAGTDKYFQAVLLSRIFTLGSTKPTYIPFARTQFAVDDTGIDVQAGLELAVYWTFSFK